MHTISTSPHFDTVKKITDLLALDGSSHPKLVQLSPQHPDSAPAFRAAITASKKANQYGAAVTVYDEAAYRDMQLFLTEDGKAGVAIKDGGDIVSLFKSAGHHPLVTNALLLEAFSRGGGGDSTPSIRWVVKDDRLKRYNLTITSLSPRGS